MAQKSSPRRSNKIVAVVCGAVLTTLQILVIVYAPAHLHPLLQIAIGLLFALPGLGAVGMILQIIKFERHPQRYILIALFIPYAFIWYYLERARGKGLRDSIR